MCAKHRANVHISCLLSPEEGGGAGSALDTTLYCSAVTDML